MLALIITGIIVLITVITVQIGKVSELGAQLRGVAEVERRSNERTAIWMVIFMVVFLVFCIVSAWYYKNYMLGYGPHDSASAHGGKLDHMFNVTLLFTGIVFVVTQIFLFWYPYKYRDRKGVVSKFFTHNNRLEAIWTFLPSIVMVYLVVEGLIVWLEVMPDVDENEDYIEIEATGSQFLWEIRYPGPDDKLGTKNFKLIDPATNPLGQDWTDEKNIDDFHAIDIVLPVDKKVRVRITAKDVLHNFYLPHFRVKMDAIPGLPTYFIFTPTRTTEDYRQGLKEYAEYHVPFFEDEPDGPQKWEMFDYELACAELCGKGHYSMRRLVKIVSEEEYEDWLGQQNSFYLTNSDPFKGRLLPIEAKRRATELLSEVQSALKAEDYENTIRLTNVFFETGSALLKDDSKYELDNIVEILGMFANMNIQISGHTDNTGDALTNQILSEERAKNVVKYLADNGISSARLTGIGMGPNRPADTNDTAEGRQNNRRIEMRILSNS